MNKLLMFLQMFAGEQGAAAVPAGGAETGAAETPAAMEGDFAVGQTMPDGTQVANAKVAAALNRQMKRHPEMRKAYAQKPMQQAQQVPAQVPGGMPQGQAGQEPAGETVQPADDGRKPWNEIKELYKDEYGADVAATIKDRFKNQADANRQLEAQKPIIEFVMQKAGAQSLEELAQIIQNDDSVYEAEAEERNMTVEQLKYVKGLEEEKARNDQAAETARNQAHIQNLFGQCEELKKVYPNIDFFTEMNNEQFRLWTSPAVGMSFEQAYMALHGKELQTQAMAYGMDRTRAQLGQTIQAQRGRPGEGAMSGMSQAAAAEPRMNPAGMDRKERKKLKDYIKAHPDRTVSFD